MKPLLALQRFCLWQRLLFCLCVLTLLSCDTALPDNSIRKLAQRGVIRVGTLYGLTTYYNGPEGPMGFEYELVENFARYLNVELDIYPFFSHKDAAEHLANGQLDLIATGEATIPFEGYTFKYGPAYQYVDQILVYRNGETRPNDLAALPSPVLVVNESSQERLLKQSSGISQALFQSTADADTEELLQRVAEGQLAYTIVDSNMLALHQRRYPVLQAASVIAENQSIAWTISPHHDDSLQAAIVNFFGRLHQSGQFNALEDKYFGHVRTFDYVDTRAYIRSINEILPQFRAWFEAYAGTTDWRLLAAMSYQESHWQPDARSPTGVRGLMMLTRATAKDWDVKQRTDPEQSIRGGAQYFASLRQRIPARIAEPDRTWMALAAYNIGLGHLEDARILTQKQGANPDLWVDVKQRLPLLRQKRFYRQTKYGYARGNEALKYVENIRRYYDTLVWIDEQDPESSPVNSLE